jgi:hypothetical protein
MTEQPTAPIENHAESLPGKLRRLSLVVAAALIAGGGVIVIARSQSTTTTAGYTPGTRVPGVYYADSAPAGGPALFTVQNDELVPFKNGATLRVGDLDVAVSVSPYPPPRTANIDFGLSRDGRPIEDANVTLSYDMRTMEHGPFTLLAIPSGPGHYVVPVTFEMDGEFYLNVAFDDGVKESVVNLAVNAKR